MIDLGHWQLHPGYAETALEPTSDKPLGFIYIIENNTTGMKYIGKKQISAVRKRPPLKGKKNKRHYEIETDWKSYMSSSNELIEDIQKHGKESFNFFIVRWCYSKFELAYYEAKMQFDHEVLLRDDFYNGIINCRIGKCPKYLVETKRQ